MKVPWTVFKLQSGHDLWQTDGRTDGRTGGRTDGWMDGRMDGRTDDPGKNNMSPNPKGGSHKKKQHKDMQDKRTVNWRKSVFERSGRNNYAG